MAFRNGRYSPYNANNTTQINQNFTRAVSAILDPFQVEDSENKERMALLNYNHRLDRINGALATPQQNQFAMGAEVSQTDLGLSHTLNLAVGDGGLEGAIKANQVKMLTAPSLADRQYFYQREVNLTNLIRVRDLIERLVQDKMYCADPAASYAIGNQIYHQAQLAQSLIEQLLTNQKHHQPTGYTQMPMRQFSPVTPQSFQQQPLNVEVNQNHRMSPVFFSPQSPTYPSYPFYQNQ